MADKPEGQILAGGKKKILLSMINGTDMVLTNLNIYMLRHTPKEKRNLRPWINGLKSRMKQLFILNPMPRSILQFAVFEQLEAMTCCPIKNDVTRISLYMKSQIELEMSSIMMPIYLLKLPRFLNA